MKIVSTFLALTFLTLNAWSHSCVNFSGLYEDVDSWPVQTTLRIEQTGCEKVIMQFKKVYDSGTVQSYFKNWITDGVEREVTPGLTGRYVHESSRVTWQERLLASNEKQAGVLFFDQEGNLVYQGDAYPAVVNMKISYRRIEVK